jgi:hypothetical protein
MHRGKQTAGDLVGCRGFGISEGKGVHSIIVAFENKPLHRTIRKPAIQRIVFVAGAVNLLAAIATGKQGKSQGAKEETESNGSDVHAEKIFHLCQSWNVSGGLIARFLC